MNYIFILSYDVCRRLPGGGKKSTPSCPCPLYLGRLHSTHPVPVWAKQAVCHKVSSARPAERPKWPKSRLSHIPHPCYLSNPWILNMFLLSGKPFTPKIDIYYEVKRFYSMIL